MSLQSAENAPFPQLRAVRGQKPILPQASALGDLSLDAQVQLRVFVLVLAVQAKWDGLRWEHFCSPRKKPFPPPWDVGEYNGGDHGLGNWGQDQPGLNQSVPLPSRPRDGTFLYLLHSLSFYPGDA